MPVKPPKIVSTAITAQNAAATGLSYNVSTGRVIRTAAVVSIEALILKVNIFDYPFAIDNTEVTN
jgi:hypothetical protein